jgi:hypothetical protein
MSFFLKRMEQLLLTPYFESNIDITDEQKKTLKLYFEKKKASEIFPIKINDCHTIDIDEMTCSHCNNKSDYESIRANMTRPLKDMISLELNSYCTGCQHFFKAFYRYKSLSEKSLKVEFLNQDGIWMSHVILSKRSIKDKILNVLNIFKLF